MHFAPSAAILDIGQNALEVPHASGQGLHLAQSTLHRLQPLADELEGLAYAFFQGALQLLVHRLLYLLQLFLVALLQRFHLGVHGVPKFLA